MSQKTNMTLLLFMALIIVGSISIAISGVHYNPIYLTENTSSTRIEYVNTTGVLYITNGGNVSVTNNERTSYQTLKAGTIYSGDIKVCLANGTNCLTGNSTGTDTWNTTSQMINATNGVLSSAGGWTNTSTTTNTNLRVGIENGTGGTPSLYFNGDSNTGLWLAGADTFGFTTAGSTKFYITSTNVRGAASNWFSLSGGARNNTFATYGWRDDEDTGLTSSGSNQFSLIAGGQEIINGTNSIIGLNRNITLVQNQQNILTSGFSGNQLLGVGGLLLVPNKTTTYNGVRQGGQTGSSFNGSQTINASNKVEGNVSAGITYGIWFTNTVSDLSSNPPLINSFNVTGNPNPFLRMSLRNSTGINHAINWRTIINSTCDVTSLSNSLNITDGSLIYATGIFNGTHTVLYVNGKFNDSDAINSGCQLILNSYGNLNLNRFIGSVSASSTFITANIYKVNIWNVSLSSSEVAAEYSLGANTPTNNSNGLVLQYLLNKTPDVMETYSNSTHVKDVAYISTGEYYHKQYDVSGVQVKTIVTT